MSTKKLLKGNFPSDLPIWPANAAEAVKIQNQLRYLVKIQDDYGQPKTIAGVDCSYDIKNNLSRAYIIVMDFSSLHIIEEARAELPTEFPYIPGFLSFREIPVILEAMKKLKTQPDMLMVDGQGVAHPRRLGIAAHLGVLTDLPAFGVAKSRLCGKFEELPPHKGATTKLNDKGEMIGYVLRSKERTNPLFISAGHKVSHETALNITIQSLRKHRLPEPTRIADKISKQKNISVLI